METCVWHSEPRRGRLIQRASQPSPWRWMQTWWQQKTPTNLEVRPLAGTRGLQHWLELCLLPACLLLPHSSFVSVTHAFRRWRAATVAGFLCLSCAPGVISSCYCPVCWLRDALAAQRTFVIMSDTLSNSLLCVFWPVFLHVTYSVWQVLLHEWTFWLIPLVLNLSLSLYFISF